MAKTQGELTRDSRSSADLPHCRIDNGFKLNVRRAFVQHRSAQRRSVRWHSPRPWCQGRSMLAKAHLQEGLVPLPQMPKEDGNRQPCKCGTKENKPYAIVGKEFPSHSGESYETDTPYR